MTKAFGPDTDVSPLQPTHPARTRPLLLHTHFLTRLLDIRSVVFVRTENG